MKSSVIIALQVAVGLLIVALFSAVETSAHDQGNDAQECANRALIAARIAKVESARPTSAELIGLLAQVRDIENEISNLLSILAGACGEDLNRDVLTRRLNLLRNGLETATERARLEKEVQATEQRRRQAEERRRREITNKAWPDQIKQAVLEGNIEIGMTDEQVTAAWGRPKAINETIRARSRDEQWVYPGSTYLYFTNGKLTTIQRTR